MSFSKRKVAVCIYVVRVQNQRMYTVYMSCYRYKTMSYV